MDEEGASQLKDMRIQEEKGGAQKWKESSILKDKSSPPTVNGVEMVQLTHMREGSAMKMEMVWEKEREREGESRVALNSS